MENTVIKRIKLLKFGNRNKPFCLFPRVIEDTKEYMTEFTEDQEHTALTEESNVMTALISILNMDFENVLSNANGIVSQYITSDEMDSDYFVRCCCDFEGKIGELISPKYLDSKMLFVAEVVARLCSEAFSTSFSQNRNDIVIDEQGYQRYKESVICAVKQGIEKIYPDYTDEIIYEIEEYLLNRIADYNNQVSMIEDIRQSLIFFRKVLKNGVPNFDSDIFTKLYIAVKNYGDLCIQDEAKNFLPVIIESECEGKTIWKSYRINRIEKFSHLVLFMIYRILKHNIFIRKCPACGRYFIPSRPNKIYCDGLFPGTKQPCSKRGPRFVRDQRLAEYEKECERLVKNLKEYIRRNEIPRENGEAKEKEFLRAYRKAKKKYTYERNVIMKKFAGNEKTAKLKELEGLFIREMNDEYEFHHNPKHPRYYGVLNKKPENRVFFE